MKIRDMALCGLFSALLAICAWICLPIGPLPVTFQTFGIFLTLGLLGGKRGTVAILCYLLLGGAGLPVFAGFQGGLSRLLGPTGGYLLGFLWAGPVYWLVTDRGRLPMALGLALGLVFCYGFGTCWYVCLYLPEGQGFWAALTQCVLPWLIPDGIKLFLAIKGVRRLARLGIF